VWRWDSDPFGVAAPSEDPDGDGKAVTLNLRFPGQYFDSETNLHYNYFRDYDPQTGRYVQADPIGLAAGSDLYGYVSGNPLSAVDMYGLSPASGTNNSRYAPERRSSACDPDECKRLRRDIFHKFNKLIKELRKYDPVSDGIGGFPKSGGGETVPGGHYKEIGELQRGLKRDLERYNRECKDNDDGDGGTFGAIARSIDEAANRPVPKPVIPDSSTSKVPVPRFEPWWFLPLMLIPFLLGS
jgi:RHS repeat-associated protein